LGTLALASDGTYVYSVANAQVQYLGEGETKVESFTIKSFDGTSKDVSFTILGVNDGAIIGDLNGIVIEDSIKTLNDFNQTEYRKTPQVSLYVFDPIVDDNQSQVLNTRDAMTMEVLGTFSAGETITIESEVLEPLNAY
jgi:VCBS repeat-containing protein